MEDEKAGDIRVPLISSFFCLCVLTGGIFLILYVFVPALSRPWFLIPAFLLIGSPWIFWLCTYIYTCVKKYYLNLGSNGPTPFHQRAKVAASGAAATVGNGGRQQLTSVASSKESEAPLTASV